MLISLAKDSYQNQPPENNASKGIVSYFERAAREFIHGKSVSWIQLYKALRKLINLQEVLPAKGSDDGKKQGFIEFMLAEKVPEHMKFDDIPHDEMDMGKVVYAVEVFFNRFAKVFPQEIIVGQQMLAERAPWDKEGDHGTYFATNLQILSRMADLLVELSMEYLKGYHSKISEHIKDLSPELHERSRVIVENIRRRIADLTERGF